MGRGHRDYYPPVERNLFDVGGTWSGEGEIVGRHALRWLMLREPFTITTRIEPLSESIRIVRDDLRFARGGEMKRTMYVERIAADRYHVTADDMPLGADVTMSGGTYTYAPYWSWSSFRGRRRFVRVREEGTFDPDGTMRGRIDLSWYRIPVAVNRFVMRRRPQ